MPKPCVTDQAEMPAIETNARTVVIITKGCDTKILLGWPLPLFFLFLGTHSKKDERREGKEDARFPKTRLLRVLPPVAHTRFVSYETDCTACEPNHSTNCDAHAYRNHMGGIKTKQFACDALRPGNGVRTFANSNSQKSLESLSGLLPAPPKSQTSLRSQQTTDFDFRFL